MKIFFSLLILSLPVCSNSLEIDINDCVKLAIDNNPVLRSKLNNLKASEYSYYLSLNSYLPKINLSHSFSRTGSEKTHPVNSFSFSASLNQSLFDYASIYSIRSSRINYEIKNADYQSYLIDLRTSVYTAFYNLLIAQENIKVNEKIVEIRKANADLINLEYQSGFESKGNMLYAKAQYEMAKLNLEKAKRQVEIEMNNLKETIGIRTDEKIMVKGDLNFEKITLDFNIDRLNEYIISNPQYKIYYKNLELAREKLKNALMDWLPKANLSLSKSFNGRQEFPDNSSWSIGISLGFGLFSSGLTYHKNNVSMLKELIKSASDDLTTLTISLKTSIINSYYEYLNALDTVNTYKVFLEANEQRYNEAMIRYMAGKMNYIDLENIEQNLIDAKQNYLNYVKNVYIKKINLEGLMSVPIRSFR